MSDVKPAPKSCPNDGAKLRGSRAHRALYPAAQLAQDLIVPRGRLYEEFKDPFRAWEAFWLAWHHRAWGIDMPVWVSDYLERVARRMIEVSRKEPAGKHLVAAVLNALELNGRGRGVHFARRGALRRQQQYAVDVGSLMKKGYTQSRAIGLVAELLEADVRTVELAVSKVKKRKGYLVPGGWEGLPSPSAAIRQIKPR